MTQKRKKAKQKVPARSRKAKKGKESLKTMYYWLAAFLALAFIAYFPLMNGGFINYDDDIYILDNPLIQNLNFSNISALFTEFYGDQYSPIAMMVMGVILANVSIFPLVQVLHVGAAALMVTFICDWLFRLSGAVRQV